MTEEGPLTAAATAAAAGLIFQSLSLPLLCNIDVANTMLLLPTDAPTGRPAGVAGRLPSAQTVTQTRRLLRFGDTNTMDGRTTDAAIAVYKRAPLRVREQLAESRTQQTDFPLLFLTPPLSARRASCRVSRLVLSLAL